MKTIILRFSDAEREDSTVRTGTVEAHNKIVSRHKSTWWAWWKKEHEALNIGLLQQIQAYSRARPLRIGLVNRKGTEKLYFARCIDCAVGNGEPIPSPDPKLTPSYYKSDRFPAWFNLSEIYEVDREEFLREFGEIPSLDPTLYEVMEDGPVKRLIPSRNWNLHRVEAKGQAILHISDLHFGEGHGYPLIKEPGRGLDLSPLIDVLISAIQEHVKVPIGAVVASGDFVSKGNANSYPHAGEFLRDLLKRLQLTKEHCVLVPGNHDLWTIDVDHPTRNYAHELPFRMFFRDFFHLEDVQELEGISRICLPGNLDLVFVALNSARIRNDKLKEYGYVSRHRYENLLRYLNTALLADQSTRKALVFAVLHHHVIPVTRVDIPDGERPVSMTLDAGELIEEFGRFNISYVLHGHQHTPFVGSVSRFDISKGVSKDRASKDKKLVVLGCGSTGAKREWLSNEIGKNVFSIYTPKDDRLEILIVQFSPYERSSVYWSGSIPLQNFYEIAQ
jgi:hypothetical protein